MIRTLMVAGLALLCGAAPAAAQGPARPNVVLILTDNQGAWTLGCHGNPDIRTPHIDRLAAEGVRFTRALSSNPVCSPIPNPAGSTCTRNRPGDKSVTVFDGEGLLSVLRRTHGVAVVAV